MKLTYFPHGCEYSVSLSEPITAKPEVQGYHIDYDSWYFLILMSSGLYKTLETYSTSIDPNVHIARLIHSELDKGKEINVVCKIVVDEICRAHRAFCAGSHLNNGCYHEDMTLLVRLFRHSDVRKQSQPLSVQSHGTRVSPTSDTEMHRNRQSYRSLLRDWSLKSITTVPSTDKISTVIAGFEANSFDKHLFQNNSHSGTSHTIPELRESVNNNQRLQHSISIPNNSLSSASLSFNQPQNLNKINAFNTSQISKAHSCVNEQVTGCTSREIIRSSQINFDSDYNGEFGQLVGSELPFSVKTESCQFFSSDDSNAAKSQNSLTKPTELKTSSNSNLVSDSKMVSSAKYKTNKYPDIDAQENNFNNLNNGESTSNDEHDTGSDSTTNLTQDDQCNQHDDISENGNTGIASLNASYADSYVNFSPLEETLRKYGVEIDELVDGS